MAYDRYNNRNNHHGSNRNHEKIELSKIVLDYEQNEQLFGDIAKNWAKQVENESFNDRGKSNGKNKINQIRAFYDKVLELQEKSEGMDDIEYKREVYPFVVMLRSKVAYAKSRGLISNTFEKMINQCVDEATTVKKMQNFKYFFEALIGFYPKK